MLRRPHGRQLVHPHPFRPYPRGFGAVVWMGNFSEPRVVQRFFGRNPAGGVVDEYPLEQVEELLRERAGERWDDFLQVVYVSASERGGWPVTNYIDEPEVSS